MGEDVQSPPPSWQSTFEYYNPLHFRRKTTQHSPASTTATTTAPVYSRDFAYAEDGKKGGVRLLAHPPMHVVDDPERKKRSSNTEKDTHAPWTSAKTFADLPIASCMAHTNPHILWWTSAHSAYGMDEAKQEHKRLLSGPTVEIFVGKERKKWCLHKNLLCHHSSYFEVEFDGHEVPRNKTNGVDEDGNEKPLRLELLDEDPLRFELFVKWLYQGKLEPPSDLEDEEAHYNHAVSCQKLHRLCEKFSLLPLANLSMDAYRLSLNTAQLVPDAEEINEIYRSSAPGSPFRKLMTRIAARQIMDPDVDKDADSYRCCFEGNTDFAVEMVNAIRSMSGGMLFEDPTTDVVDEDGEGDSPCEYHDHSDGSRCIGGPSPVKVRTKPVAKRMANGDGATPSVLKHPVVQLLPAELSAERRTPRKLNVEPPRTPTPKGGASRRAPASVNGESITQPRKASSTVPKKKPQPLPNGLSHSQPQPKTQAAVNGHANAHFQTPTRPLGPSLDSLSLASGPRKLARTPAKQMNGAVNGSSVLGKRRATEGAPAAHGKAGSINGATPRKASQGVNGIVQHWNGINGDQSDGGAELPHRKIAPKLRRTQAV